MVARPTSLTPRLLGCSANFLDTETTWWLLGQILLPSLLDCSAKLLATETPRLLGQILSPRLLLRSISLSPASVCWALIRRSHPRRPTCAGLGSSTSPSMASLTPGLSTSTSPSMASVRWTFISSTHRRRPGSLLDFHHRHHRRWPTSAGLNLIDSSSTARLTPGLSSSTSSSMASIRWTFIIDITVDGQRLLDLISSTHRRRPACCWTYPRRLVVDGQRAAGLTHVDSSSTASVPLDFLASTCRRRPAYRWTFSSQFSRATPSLCRPTPSLRRLF